MRCRARAAHGRVRSGCVPVGPMPPAPRPPLAAWQPGWIDGNTAEPRRRRAVGVPRCAPTETAPPGRSRKRAPKRSSRGCGWSWVQPRVVPWSPAQRRALSRRDFRGFRRHAGVKVAGAGPVARSGSSTRPRSPRSGAPSFATSSRLSGGSAPNCPVRLLWKPVCSAGTGVEAPTDSNGAPLVSVRIRRTSC